MPALSRIALACSFPVIFTVANPEVVFVAATPEVIRGSGMRPTPLADLALAR
ncbi:hypothetical protein HETIRDRAFT_437573 [Heterobasidion irregulare TC 32-1]|uniref:Uncharacterized protein n=1 Tax=Heterobasidion irregulare (strain TC 32-1) TaxID=747525 RepID=W4KP56_HETIT|nr:uncharacterized protein HETIRDRAFT_437573 [Heterobasidion irregulare TC 32-1]ETW86806.1 hypothetical protein HETIRDRAFT_437573 [Heterobasidion irregulare TC 32-1]